MSIVGEIDDDHNIRAEAPRDLRRYALGSGDLGREGVTAVGA